MTKRIAVITIILIIAVAVTASASEWVGKSVYLKYNLKYDAARLKASCLNYQSGMIIKAGTKITILSYNRRRINIQTGDAIVIKMEYSIKYTGKTPESWLEMVTIDTDPKPEWKKSFTENEWKGIRNGRALLGMTKEAVIVALGYPPAHKTPTVELDRWQYWANRFAHFGVLFSKNKVVEVGSAGR